MTPANCKKLLEAGILQAYAEGKVIQFSGSGHETWQDIRTPGFENHPSSYRIKPEPTFKVGDLVRVHGEDIATIKDIVGPTAVLNTGKRGHITASVSNLTPIKEVRTPFTFEQAVKAVAEHGVIIKVNDKEGEIIGFDNNTVYVKGVPQSMVLFRTDKQVTFLDGTPFCNIEYGDVE